MFSLLWIPATLVAAAAQTARNATQRGLVDTIGMVGATQARFLFGLPFAILFLVIASIALGAVPPRPDRTVLSYAFVGSLTQIAATALMLAAMRQRSFAVTTAFIKTEPILTAVAGVVVLGEALSATKAGAILLATTGVMIMGLAPVATAQRSDREPSNVTVLPMLLGVAAGGFFGLSAVCFRGAIVGLPDAHFLQRASTILVLSLAIQSVLLVVGMAIFQRSALRASLAAWRASLAAGFLGALASQFWFIGFSLTSAANVRTLALVEVFMARLAGRRLFHESGTIWDGLGMALVVVGVAIVLFA